MRKIKKSVFFTAAAIAFVIVGVIVYGAVAVYQYLYGMQLHDAKEGAPALEANEYNIMYKGEYNQKAVLVEDYIYLDMDVINEEWAQKMLFYAEDVNQVYYTTYTEMTEYTVGGEEFKEWNGEIYMKGQLAREMFGTQYTINEKSDTVTVQDPGGLMGEVTKPDSYLFVSTNEGERGYTKELKRGEVISLFEAEDPGYYFAMSHDGYTGYIAKDRVQESAEVISQKVPADLEMSYYKLPSEPVSIAWQQLYNNDFTGEVYNSIASAGYYINVISPTWFKLTEDGGISSLANEDYVIWNRSRGVQVWALFDNQFNDEITYAVLSNTQKRQALSQKLLEYCQTYNLNGINVDFENMSEKTYPYFIQFMRELSIVLRSEGYLLSVDCMVPSAWSDYHQRDVLSKLCDYVIVMAYDEHYSGSEIAGSVSSQKFAVEAVYNMLEEGVSSDKLILGVPFYTRVWMGQDGDELVSEAVGMDTAWGYVNDYELEVNYDEETGHNYAEGMVGDTLYRIWLEDTTSMKWRIQLVQDNQLAGLAAWSLGFEGSDLWTVYEEAFYS